MRDIFKIGALAWGTIFLIIFVVISFCLLVISLFWWLLTNNMIDRSTFLLISFLTSLGVSIIGTVLGTLKNKK